MNRGSGTAHMRARGLAYLLVAGATLRCTGIIGSGAGAGSDGTDPVGQDAEALCSKAAPSVGASPLRRLTRTEYTSSVRDLLQFETDIGTEFVADEEVAGYAANSVSSVSKLQLEDYLDAAEQLASLAVAAHEARWLGCDVEQTSCVAPFIAWMSKRAFRRPVAPELEAGLAAVYEDARASWGGAKAVELVLAAMLSSPHFLYHLELSVPDQGDAVALLDDFELASRLSYLFWGSMPDDELFAVADAGALGTAEGLEQQARRMLDDPRFGQAVDSFASQWLELETLVDQVKDPVVHPAWTEELALSMKRESLAFVRSVVEEGASASTLLTATHTFVDAPLAALYGVEPPAGGGAELARVELDPDQRAGLLTQGAFLASRAHAAETSWALRGKFVREKLLCETLPPPPPGVDQKAANDPDRLTSPECSSCHLRMDPIGLGFENYDAVGRYRAEDADGQSIVAEGEVVDHDEIGTFVGAIELAGALAQSDAVTHCLVTQWFRFAARRQETGEDVCSIEAAGRHFASSGHDIRELLVAVATSDAFRYRRLGEGE